MRFKLLAAMAALVAGASAAHAQTPTPVAPTFRLCTGSAGGAYHSVIFRRLREQVGTTFALVEVPSAGSGDNLNKMFVGKVCDGVLAQSDAVLYFLRNHPGVSIDYDVASDNLYEEALHLICNHDDNVYRITKLTAGMKVQIGPDAGGTSTTWDNLVKADSGTYGKISTGPLDTDFAAQAVLQHKDKSVCMAQVISAGAPAMSSINENGVVSHKLSLVSTDDSDLVSKVKDPKGNPVYTKVVIKKGTYPGLQTGDVSAAGVKTQLLVSQGWIDGNMETYRTLMRILPRATINIRADVGQND